MADELRHRLAAGVGARYEIGDEIGRGGMGVVFRARDLRLRRPVAIKLLPPEMAFREEIRSRFLREAQTAAQLNHPQIVPIYSVDDVDGLVFFVMALVEGESLAVRLRREPRPPVEFVRRVLRDVASALEFAHARAVIHRDIKPDNILLDDATGRTMVSDFGIARAAEGDARLTATGVAVGTPAYMSPEQAIGEREIDGRSDLYALGVVGYQMLVGELPFSATNTPAMLMKHINEPPRPLREVRTDVPPGLERAIGRALAKRADDRWPDAAAFRQAVDDDAWDPRTVRASEAPAAPARPAQPREPLPARLAQQAALHQAVRIADVARGNGHPRDTVRPEPRAPAGPAVPPRAPGPSLPGPESGVPGAPPIPAFMPASWADVRRQWRAYGRDHRLMVREQRRLLKEQLRAQRAAGSPLPLVGPRGEVPVEYRIRDFRTQFARTATSVAVLAGINFVFSPLVPWFLVPAAFMSLGVMRRAGNLWGEGVRVRDVFGKDARLPANVGAMPPASGAPLAAGADPQGRAFAVARAAGALATPEVLVSQHGEAVRRAAEDRLLILEAIGKLSKADRELIPDVAPTVDALVERIAGLAQALHRLDNDIAPDSIGRIEARIAAAEAEPDSDDREKKLTLLRRQRATLADLIGRRDGLAAQLDSASVMLQTIRLDLVALRNAGVQSSIDDVSSATQEARALSRDIGHVLDAAKQVRE